ncbi:unnamed protein product [Cuscuta campestris]|uniref:Uncharacterized protein n=1 Tax=Cuscuta campestris TaxID=132261 RepID=A0A484KDB0_9ASTE|nr:unnamed protein product [Cuscuta campestris]
MEEFLEVLSLQQQTVSLEIKRKQRAAAASSSQEDMQEMMALQQKKAAFEKKWREAIADPNVRRPTVIELFGELHHSEPLPPSPPSPVDPTSPPPATSSVVGESSGSLPGEVRESDDEGKDRLNLTCPRPEISDAERADVFNLRISKRNEFDLLIFVFLSLCKRSTHVLFGLFCPILSQIHRQDPLEIKSARILIFSDKDVEASFARQ